MIGPLPPKDPDLMTEEEWAHFPQHHPDQIGLQRYVNYIALECHPWLNKVWKRLGKKDHEMCRAILKRAVKTSKGNFELFVNRLFMDKAELRELHPKWKEITELLLGANSKLSDEVPNEPNAAKLTEALRFGPKK